MTKLGGATEKDVLKNIMEATFSNKVAETLNWKGNGPKTGIERMEVASAIISKF